MSFRGIRECLACKPGDYCTGCDGFTSCPAYPGAGQDKKPTIQISRPRAYRRADCQRCEMACDADLDRSRCVPKFRDKCDVDLLERCIESCDPTSTQCEYWQCRLFCANDQAGSNPGCLKAHDFVCHDLRAAQLERQNEGKKSALVATTTIAPQFQVNNEIAEQARVVLEEGCQLDCSGATSITFVNGGSLLHLGAFILLYNFIATGWGWDI